MRPDQSGNHCFALPILEPNGRPALFAVPELDVEAAYVTRAALVIEPR